MAGWAFEQGQVTPPCRAPARCSCQGTAATVASGVPKFMMALSVSITSAD